MIAEVTENQPRLVVEVLLGAADVDAAPLGGAAVPTHGAAATGLSVKLLA